MIEFAPTLGEDALIGRAPVRPRGRSSSSSINNHSISSEQQRSSSIANSPDPWSQLCRDGEPSLLYSPLSPPFFTHALYIPLSLPRSSYTWPFIRPRWLLTEKYTEGLHPERPARGAVLYTGKSRPCIEHTGPPSTKNMHTQRRP